MAKGKATPPSTDEPSLIRPTAAPQRHPFLFILQNTQFIVTALTLVFLVLLHSAHASWFCLGTLVALGSAKGLKLLIKQPRPSSAKKYGKAYGMPSTHSSSMAYFGVYLSLSSLLFPLHPTLARFLVPFWTHVVHHFTGVLLVRYTLAAFCLASAAAVCWSRVRLGHHTPAQVLAGASLGSVVALVWLALWIGLDAVPEGDRLAWKLPKQLGWLKGGVKVFGERVEGKVEAVLRRGWAAWHGGYLSPNLAKSEFWGLWREVKKIAGEL